MLSLRTQLVLIALLSLALPWAGCEYVRQTEQGLRENQQALLELTAANIAATLTRVPFPDQPGADRGNGVLYLASLTRPPLADGYVNDWLPGRPLQAATNGEPSVSYVAAEYEGSAYLFVRTTDRTAKVITVFAVGADGTARSLRVNLDVRGASIVAPTPASNLPGRAQVFIEQDAGRRHAEFSLPLALVTGGLGVQVSQASGEVLSASFGAALPPAPILKSRTLMAALARVSQPGVRIDVVSPARWLVASVGRVSAQGGQPDTAELLPRRILRWVLKQPADPGVLQVGVEKAGGTLLDQALDGQRGSERIRTSASLLNADVVTVAPIRGDDRVRGAVILTQRSAAQLLPGNRALQLLAIITLAATFGTVLLLVGYAAWLSTRIQRLSRATDRALDVRGRLSPSMPSNRAADEIGDLARSVETLLGRVRDYHDYLRALASRLSHELSTPLSVVSSSLDNLEAELAASEQSVYAARARDGVERLRSILGAMREATRMEQYVVNATYERVELAELIANVVSGYRGAYPTHRFQLDADSDGTDVVAAPALLVQLLDKLVDNAVSFAPPESTIDIGLAREGAAVALTVSNVGSVLTDEQQDSMFESLVSHRAEGSGPHMGFGLYVARLIAEGHRGRLSAANRADSSGVEIKLTLPLAAAPASLSNPPTDSGAAQSLRSTDA